MIGRCHRGRGLAPRSHSVHIGPGRRCFRAASLQVYEPEVAEVTCTISLSLACRNKCFFMAEFNFDGNLSKTSGARNRPPRDSLFFCWQKNIEAKTKFLRSRSFPEGEGLTQAGAFSLKSKLCSAMNGHQRSQWRLVAFTSRCYSPDTAELQFLLLQLG